ncbi:conserved hypothetical protein [Histoplasma capsulatum var. duboisii H88]|uniref:F-box domain-containing protein n=2 Tax=Ajellomyces capsulatus TaxID=5037 RepID=F0U6Q0_AJEC8|nr:conserved hypothetical protein [Histoplasma capsulatum var. duboisii H88]
MAMAAAHRMPKSFTSGFLTVPEQRNDMGAFARMPPLTPVKEMRMPLTIRQRRRFPNNLSIILPDNYEESLPQLRTTSHDQQDVQSLQNQQDQYDQQTEQDHLGEKSAEAMAAEWMCWLKIMVPDTNIQWYVTDNRNEIYKFYVDYQIIKSLWDGFSGGSLIHYVWRVKENSSPSPPAALIKLPIEIVMMIFNELDVPDQVCLGLTSKALANITRHLNGGYGVLYDSSMRLQILFRLESWMTDVRRLCMACGKYFPLDPLFWKERKRQGRCRTRSMVYGRVDVDFEFQGETCPECAAAISWGNIAMAHIGMQIAVR